MLGGIFIIMAFYLLGECCAWLINDFVPGSVLGMMFFVLGIIHALGQAGESASGGSFPL